MGILIYWQTRQLHGLSKRAVLNVVAILKLQLFELLGTKSGS